MNILAKLLFLFLGIDLLAYWIFYWDWRIFALWVINSLMLFYISWFFPENFWEKAKDFLVKIFYKSKKLKKIKDNPDLENISNNKNFNDFLLLLKEINRDYIIVISFFIFLYSLLAKIMWVHLDINIYVSAIIFIISFIFWYKDIISGEIFLWKRKLKFIDFIFLASLFIFYVFFNLKGNLALYEKFLIASLAGFIFFIWAKSLLWVREVNYKNYKPSLFYIYIISISGFIFLYNYFNIWNMYKDFYVWHTKIKKITLWEKTYITAKNIKYKIKKIDGKYFINDNKKNLFFTLDQAENYILSLEEKSDSELENKLLNISEKSTSTGAVADKTLTGIVTDRTLIPFLLKDKDYLDDLYDDNLEFKNISKQDPNYKYYNVAYALKMIRLNSDLTDKVKCQNYLAMLWMSQRWDMSAYKWEWLFVKYYKEALKKWLVPDECKNNIKNDFKWEYLEK